MASADGYFVPLKRALLYTIQAPASPQVMTGYTVSDYFNAPPDLETLTTMDAAWWLETASGTGSVAYSNEGEDRTVLQAATGTTSGSKAAIAQAYLAERQKATPATFDARTFIHFVMLFKSLSADVKGFVGLYHNQNAPLTAFPADGEEFIGLAWDTGNTESDIANDNFWWYEGNGTENMGTDTGLSLASSDVAMDLRWPNPDGTDPIQGRFQKGASTSTTSLSHFWSGGHNVDTFSFHAYEENLANANKTLSLIQVRTKYAAVLGDLIPPSEGIRTTTV